MSSRRSCSAGLTGLTRRFARVPCVRVRLRTLRPSVGGPWVVQRGARPPPVPGLLYRLHRHSMVCLMVCLLIWSRSAPSAPLPYLKNEGWQSCQNASQAASSVIMQTGISLDASRLCQPGNVKIGKLVHTRRLPELHEEVRFHDLIVTSVIGRAFLAGRQRLVMIELGSYWAYYSLIFAKLVAEAKLHAVSIMVEPSPHKLHCGMRNFATNGFCSEDRVQARWLRAMICAPDAEKMTGYGGLMTDETSPVCTTIPNILHSFDVVKVEVLLADIQGAELEALRSANLSRIHHVWVGTHSINIHQQCKELLLSSGFMIEYEVGLIRSDGYIHAFNPSF